MQQFIMRQKMSSSLTFSIFKILARIRIKKRCSIVVRLIKKGGHAKAD